MKEKNFIENKPKIRDRVVRSDIEGGEAESAKEKEFDDYMENYVKQFDDPGLRESILRYYERFHTESEIINLGLAGHDNRWVSFKHKDEHRVFEKSDNNDEDWERVDFWYDKNQEKGILGFYDAYGSSWVGDGSYEECLKWLHDNRLIEK